MHALKILAAMSVLAIATPAQADGDMDADIMRIVTQFGLRGDWAPDCYKAVKPENPRLSIDFSHLGLREISVRTLATGLPAELMSIENAAAVPPDMLELQLDSLTIDAAVSYKRTDTYQRIGERVRLYRSEVTQSSPRAQAIGYRLGVVVDRGSSPILESNGNVRAISPVLERCQD